MDDATDPPIDAPTPDRLLHTGAEGPVDPEDLVRLTGKDVTPERLEQARRLLEEHGPAAVERYLP
ncbi:hypothetical protein [Streptomyces spiramenti]|uniref:Cation-transporting P-type ATPase N-terminal domain-containing protein n=1 Tax=Streptomyces spiramenti TaxID=2720606 RepID=A0ABX1AGH9_9ACTN|nr:hypothetical protein [Streptomyces spiramenti]NJP66294.1 hypothetical protein [Streptomyces spiramenti]